MNSLSLLNDAKYFDEGNSKFAELRTLLDSKHAKVTQHETHTRAHTHKAHTSAQTRRANTNRERTTALTLVALPPLARLCVCVLCLSVLLCCRVLELEAMKRLMAMVTIGRDVSSFFPDVVKNVVVESAEVKKLVYMYLIHYAEQNQELALLSINTFQKDLVSPSQRVRGNAMKAMSSIRIPVAIPLVILALKAAVKDSSSYVRRAAAAAIPKVFAVDPDQHELLLELIQELLTNNEPLVLGSTIFAFNAVCPDRLDMLHAHFRKICHLLADFDEWGQIITLELLLRYGRTQFLAPPRGIGAPDDEEDALSSSPDAPHHSSADAAASSSASAAESASKKPAAAAKKSTKFYSDDEDASDHSHSSHSGSDSDSDSSNAKKKKKRGGKKAAATDTFSSLASFATPAASASSSARMAPGPLASPELDRDLDEDHKLLLKQASQLLQSSNTGVIVAVSSLMWALAPREELSKVIKPLVRLSRNKRNMQYIVLTTIATMASSHPSFFRPYLKDFFVFAHEPRYIKLLKLDILAAITAEESIGAVLKECAIYTLDPDTAFVTATVVAIGRVATRMPSIAARCIRGLMGLVQSGSHAEVVAQSIVVIRQLLQANVANITAPLLHSLAMLLDGATIQSADARCALVWMVGEYRAHLPAYAPDVLRKLAKSFASEADPVKVQILNLALKLFLSNPKQTSTLFKYVMDLAKYDTNIDLRDRARMFRTMFFKKKAAAAEAAASSSGPLREVGSEVKDHFKSILLLDKPAPKLVLPFAGRDRWILGTMSHTLDRKVPGYVELPQHPTVQPDPSVRKPKVAVSARTRMHTLALPCSSLRPVCCHSF